jgi:cell division protein FtsI/penicillin-binding protein 2
MIASVDMLVPAVRETGLSGTIVGKTSTARAGTEKYSVNFAGYAPADAPRFVVAVRFTAEAKDQPSGGIIAGSVAADLMKSLLNSGF